MSQIAVSVTGLAGLACFMAFSWGVRGHFRSTGAMPRGMQLTSALSLGFALLFFWSIAHGVSGQWGGAVGLFAAGLGVFVWAVRASRKTPPTLAFDTDLPSFLLKSGPYRHVRHPFYLAYVLFWLGTALAVPGLAGWAAPVVMTALYAHAASKEERKFERSGLAADYAAYRAKAGMFWPRLLAG
jgi:protein-S-isoprenylcysteine O-methyltransferase Ste14